MTFLELSSTLPADLTTGAGGVQPSTAADWSFKADGEVPAEPDDDFGAEPFESSFSGPEQLAMARDAATTTVINATELRVRGLAR
jgi:hypothetical protein